MHIVLLGAGGHVAQRIAREALARGHQVTAVVRDPASFQSYDSRLTVVRGDATNKADIARVAAGADAIVNAVSPRPSPSGRPASSLVAVAHAVIAGARQAGVKRVVVVGGAGSLEVGPGRRRMDQPDFPAAYKPESAAQADALAAYRSEAAGLEWTYISPADVIEPGERTGTFRTGGDQMLFDMNGRSVISFEDYAAALVNELEKPAHIRRRMTVAY
ncbi:MAG: NAD(P)-dependent oxidoreductase [Gemmatimonadaceae bacterium]